MFKGYYDSWLNCFIMLKVKKKNRKSFRNKRVEKFLLKII